MVVLGPSGELSANGPTDSRSLSLTDTNAQNGALRILPASHRKSAPIHTVLPEAHGHTAEELEPGPITLSDRPGQLTLCLRAGDAVVIDYRLLHGTHGSRWAEDAAIERQISCAPFLAILMWSIGLDFGYLGKP
jgi:Phytanoyl-CoA dioxygenase (PhyH)